MEERLLREELGFQGLQRSLVFEVAEPYPGVVIGREADVDRTGRPASQVRCEQRLQHDGGDGLPFQRHVDDPPVVAELTRPGRWRTVQTVGGEGSKRLPDALRLLRPVDRLPVQSVLEKRRRRLSIAADELGPLWRIADCGQRRRWAANHP